MADHAEPRRIQLKRTKGWKMPENTVRVARPGRWGNPFPVDLLGRALAVEMFRDLMTGFFDPYKMHHLTNAQFDEVYAAKTKFEKRLNWGLELRSGARNELRGKNLACFCKLTDACHADVLLELANQPVMATEGGDNG